MSAPIISPWRRLLHWLPVRLRQYWKLLALSVVVAVGLVVPVGAYRIYPYITGDATIIASEITDNIAGTVDLFDAGVAHSLVLDISQVEYQEMIAAYEDNGEKNWVTADVTIDDTFISDVAVRLKGNSPLMSLRGRGSRPDGPKGDQAADGGEAAPEAMPQMSGMPGMLDTTLSADDPTSLPLLISFSESADGRGYQGMTELSVRPGTPVLNEALALSLTSATGQPSQRFSYARYTINGETSTRLLLEHPDETYANSLFDSRGYLYKADSMSRLEFRGTDQAEYADQFTQINSPDNGTLQPIINLLQWLDGADAHAFDDELGEWVDVEALARYVATQNLLVNPDDMAGPGQNYYLWYDLDTELITVVSWDLNLAMQGDATTRPDEAIQMGPPGGRDGANAVPVERKMPEGENGQPMIGNQLKTRFLESKKWSALYHEVYWQLYDQIYGDGLADVLLDQVVADVPLTDGLSQEQLDTGADELRGWVDERSTALRE